MEIELTRGLFAIVDDQHFAHLSQYKWHALKTKTKYYAVRTSWIKGQGRGKMIYMHREIMKPEDHLSVDHINGNSLDNRISNMRVVTHSQNLKNLKVNARNKSGFKGVSFIKNDKKWLASIQVNGKSKSLGRYLTKEDAYKAYCDASKEFHGEFGRIL